jgi:uncharacterized protein (DUF2384 family)
MTAEEVLAVWPNVREVYREEGALIWLGNPNPMLEMRRPIDCRKDRVEAVLLALAEGVFS